MGFNECYIPYEVIKAPGFKMSVVYGDRIPTNEIEIKVESSGYTEKIENQKITPSVSEQMDTMMYKYTTLCNDIYKECKEIEKRLNGGTKND